MQDTLKPCPFCAGEAELVDFDPINCFVECRKCRASQPALYNKVDKQSAVESWNRRTDDADRARLVARIDEANKVIFAQAAQVEALTQELVQATDQLLSWHYDTKHEWGYPMSLKVWENNPLRKRYKELTGNEWVGTVEEDEEAADNE